VAYTCELGEFANDFPHGGTELSLSPSSRSHFQGECPSLLFFYSEWSRAMRQERSNLKPTLLTGHALRLILVECSVLNISSILTQFSFITNPLRRCYHLFVEEEIGTWGD
jgi:hypothetical protein